MNTKLYKYSVNFLDHCWFDNFGHLILGFLYWQIYYQVKFINLNLAIITESKTITHYLKNYENLRYF